MKEEYSDITVELSDVDKETLVRAFVQENLNGASISKFYEELSIGGDVAAALHCAVVNEMILVAITEQACNNLESPKVFMTANEIERQIKLAQPSSEMDM